MEPVRAAGKQTQPSEESMRIWAMRRRNSKALMVIGCLGSLLSVGLCTAGAVAPEFFGWTFLSVIAIGLTGIIVRTCIPTDVILEMERRRTAKMLASRILGLLRQGGGAASIADLVKGSDRSRDEVERALGLLRDRGLVVIEEDEEGRRKGGCSRSRKIRL